MKSLQYQQDAIKELVDKTITLLRLNGNRKQLVFKAPTGAGKTTLVNLLMKFYEIDKGQIAIDGVDTRLMSREEVHDQFSMVLQDTWLFEGTIKENLIYKIK